MLSTGRHTDLYPAHMQSHTAVVAMTRKHDTHISGSDVAAGGVLHAHLLGSCFWAACRACRCPVWVRFAAWRAPVLGQEHTRGAAATGCVSR